MKRYTVSNIMTASPCATYSLARVVELWAGRDGLTAAEIGALPLPSEDRLWALTHVCLSERNQRILVCDCAGRALVRERGAGREPDPRSVEAVSVARLYADGKTSSTELRIARSAAWAATWAATCDASRDAAWDAAWAADWDATRNASRAATWAAVGDSEREWQVARAVELAGGGRWE
jgi:hypothetical protein